MDQETDLDSTVTILVWKKIWENQHLEYLLCAWHCHKHHQL